MKVTVELTEEQIEEIKGIVKSEEIGKEEIVDLLQRAKQSLINRGASKSAGIILSISAMQKKLDKAARLC